MFQHSVASYSLPSDLLFFFFFFFNDTATTEIYTLSLHDALPILSARGRPDAWSPGSSPRAVPGHPGPPSHSWRDRKSTRLNSSHGYISYAVFCLKKKKTSRILQPYSKTITTVKSPTTRSRTLA